MGLLLLIAFGARANDEYVNPRFCYRVIQPPGPSTLRPLADGAGVTLERKGPCPGPSCITITIAAGHPRNIADAPRGHDYYRSLGWTAGRPVRRMAAGTAWVEYPMRKDGVAMIVLEHVRGHGEAAHVITARFPREAASRVRQDLDGILRSWRWISACV